MDIQRSILIVALAVVSYLMVLQWNEDYGQAALPAEVSTSTAATPALPDTPAATASAGGDDIPTAVAEPTAAAVAPTAAASDELIRVKTDVLDLAIDPRGGDVVQLRLPQYPRRQDRPDVPFQLFDNGGERTYLAQSGLIGQNAPDKSSGRALWSSEKTSYAMADGQDPVYPRLFVAALNSYLDAAQQGSTPAAYRAAGLSLSGMAPRLSYQRLEQLLREVILPGTDIAIAHRWSGIMGMGAQKRPIVEQLSAHVYCGVRLGGMGVAIGSKIGQELADLV